MKEKKCAFCGREFMPISPFRIYCTKSCRQKAYNSRNRYKRTLMARHYYQKEKDRCWFCDSTDNLENHHVRYIDDLNEVIVTCRSCHKKLHTIISKRVVFAEV
jgi:ferredoxin